MLSYFGLGKYILNVNLKHRQICIFLLEQKAPIHVSLDPNSLRKNFFLSLPIWRGLYLKEFNMNAIELLLHLTIFFIIRQFKIFIVF